MKQYSGTTIPRYQVFTLADGTFVVQWEDKRVQELLTGQYREFDYRQDFGHAITNYELAQLRASGRVEHFNRQFVWLFPLPEASRFGRRRILGRGNRIRAYYLTTTLPKSQLESTRTLLTSLNLDKRYIGRLRDGQVVVLDDNGVPFRTLDEAENAQKEIQNAAPQALTNLSIAFIETNTQTPVQKLSMERDNARLNLDEIIASQTDTLRYKGRLVVLALPQDDERDAFAGVAKEMTLDIKVATSANQARELLEDYEASLFIMDIQFYDLHGFSFIGNLREIEDLRELPILVVTDKPDFTATVAKVEYLVRPLNRARIRHNIWMALKQSNTMPDKPSGNSSD